MTERKIKVAFDATACLGLQTGIGRFTSETLGELAHDSSLDLNVFAVTWRGREDLKSHCPPSVRVVKRPFAARPLHTTWQRWNVPPIEWWTGAIDVVHGTNYVVPPTRRGASVVTVHDLTPLRFPELANEHTRTFPRLIARAIARGAWVHTSSNFVANEVREHFAVADDRVVSIPGGVTALGEPTVLSDGRAGVRLAGGERYILALGTIEPRKDLPALVDAFDELSRSDATLRLVLAGSTGWSAEAVDRAIARSHASERIVRLGRIDENQRAALLRGATVLAYPSRYEGFGLPPLEAMDAGTPVVCTDAGSLPEVVGDAARMVSAEALIDDRAQGIADLAQALRSVIDDSEVRSELIARGKARAAHFTWAKTARGYADLYRAASMSATS